MLLFSGEGDSSASETSSDDMAPQPSISDSATHQRVRAKHGHHDQSHRRKKPRVETSSPARLDVNWPGSLTTVDSEIETDLEKSQRELQGEYSAQIDPLLTNSTLI